MKLKRNPRTCVDTVVGTTPLPSESLVRIQRAERRGGETGAVEETDDGREPSGQGVC